jgi:hypothetical protein
VFSLFNRFLSKKSPDNQIHFDVEAPIQIDFFNLIAQEEEGLFFDNF